MSEVAYGTEALEDGVYSLTTTTRYNAAAQLLTSVQKQLISQLSALIKSKSVFVSERGLTSVQWTEYSEHTKRVQYSTVSTSSITSKAVTVDGRWMGRDPYMERSSKCLTNYVWNSPTDSVDLLGRDRAYITFNSEHDNTFFHATLRVDNWYIINGKYKKKGYVNYDFRPIVSGINEWIAIWSILNVLATPLVATATVYKTTAAQRTKEAGYKISNPCQDAILIRELDKEVGTFKIYNFAFRNCQWWVTFRYNIGMDYNQPCCNPDGTRYEKS